MAYDYAAALTVAAEIKEDILEAAGDLLRLMDARIKLDDCCTKEKDNVRKWSRERTKFENKAGKNANEIFEILKYLMGEAGIKAKKEDWKSYDRINERIILELR